MKKHIDYDSCILCPRECRVDRNNMMRGICKVTSELKLARAALHYWEEPCISGEKGSGAVFFTGCNLHCVYCQNEEISWGNMGRVIDDSHLAEIFLELKELGANNINLVTPGQYIPHIIDAIGSAKRQGLDIPFIYNCGGYEKVDSLRRLEGFIDVYLPDFKYMSPKLSEAYSNARDYSAVVKPAIEEMHRQKPDVCFDKAGLITEGVIVRHLLLPGGLKDSKRIVKYLNNTYGDSIYISLMSQYTPLPHVRKYKELDRRVTEHEYNQLVKYALEIGVENAFIQEGDVAKESFIPHFDNTGV